MCYKSEADLQIVGEEMEWKLFHLQTDGRTWWNQCWGRVAKKNRKEKGTNLSNQKVVDRGTPNVIHGDPFTNMDQL